MPEGSSPKRVTTDSKANRPANCSESATNPAVGNSCWCQISTVRRRCLQQSEQRSKQEERQDCLFSGRRSFLHTEVFVFIDEEKKENHVWSFRCLYGDLLVQSTQNLWPRWGGSSASQESSKLRHGCFKQQRQYAGGATRGKQWQPFICRRSKVWV